MGDYAQQQSTTQSGSAPVTTGSPAPQTARDALPTAQEVASGDSAASLQGLSRDAIDRLIDKMIGQAHQVLKGALDDAIAQIKLTADVPPVTDGIGAALGKLVEIVTAFALSGLGRAAAGFLEKKLAGDDGSGPSFDSLGDAGKEIGKKAGPALGSVFEHTATSSTGNDPSSGNMVRPGASLVEEFGTREWLKLQDRVSKSYIAMEAVRARLSHVDPTRLARFAEELASVLREGPFYTQFYTRVILEWLNFRTRLALDHAPSDAGPLFAGANTTAGLHPTTDAAHSWRYSDPQGLMKIYVDVPDQIYGLAGLTLDSVTVNAGPGPTRTLRDMRTPLSQVPIYRQVWFRSVSNPITTTEPAFVMTPEGQHEIDLGNPVLAAIGSMRPVAFEEAADSRSMAAPAVVPTVADTFRASQAKAGAAVVAKWLTLYTTERLP
jgi:hypothetical protein